MKKATPSAAPILLENCQIKKLVASMRSIQTTRSNLPEKLQTGAEYFRRNARRMRYPSSIASGMFWTVRGVNAILALRCSMFNGRFGDYRETRQAA